MRVLILLAVLNGVDHLLPQIISIKNQVGIELDVLIRDDGSNDNSVEFIKNICTKNSNFDFLEDSDGPSGSAAANFFKLIINADFSKYDYVALSDQDDIWDPLKLKRATDALGGGFSCYSSNLLAFNQKGYKSWYIRKDFPINSFDFMFQGGSAGCTYVFENKFAVELQNFLKAQNFNSLIGLSHDWLLYAFARKKAFHWYFDSNSYIFYRQHLSNVYGDAGLWGNLIKKYNLIGSKWYRVQVKRILELIGVDDIPDSILSWANSGPYYKRIGIIKHVFALRRRRGESILLTLFILLGIA